MTEQTVVESVEAPVEATETPAEAVPTPPEAAPAPAPEPVSGKLGTLLKREQQFQAKVQAQKAAIAAEREAVAKEKAEIESLKARYAKVKDDPIEALKETGLNYEELTRKILNADTPEAKIELLQQRIEAFEQARVKEQQELTQRETKAWVESRKNEIKDHVFGHEDKFPTLSLFDPEVVREAAWDVVTRYFHQTQDFPDLVEVAEFLENQEAERLRVLEERRSKRVAPASPPVKAASSPKTLSNAKVSERATVSLPPDYSKMSAEEQRKHDTEFLAKHLWKD